MTISEEPLGKFRSDLVVEPMKKDGAVSAWRVTDPVARVTHVLTDLEYVVATAMDGKRGVTEVARVAAKSGYPVQIEHVERFHRELEGMSFVLRDDVPAPPPLTHDHRADALRFVDEAKRELAAGRIQVARDLLDAALAIDRVAVGAAPAAPSSSGAPGESFGPVLEFLRDWPALGGPHGGQERPAPPAPSAPPASVAPHASAAAPHAFPAPPPSEGMIPLRTETYPRPETPPMPAAPPTPATGSNPFMLGGLDDVAVDVSNDAIEIPVETLAPVPARRRRRAPLVVAAAASLAVGVVVADRALHLGLVPDVVPIPAMALAFDDAPAPAPTPPVAAAPPAATPAPSETPPSAATSPPPANAPPAAPVDVARAAFASAAPPATPVAAPVAPPPADAPPAATTAPEDEVKQAAAPVVAPAKGKFARALVAPGVSVKEGQRLAVFIDAATSKQSVLTAPAAGVFEPKVALGKRVAKGDVVAVVHPW